MNIYDEALEKLGNTVIHHIDEIGNIKTHKLSESNEYKLLKQALTDYEQLQRDVKRYFEIKNTIDKHERLNKKSEIPNELWVKFRYIKKDVMKLLKVGK